MMQLALLILTLLSVSVSAFITSHIPLASIRHLTKVSVSFNNDENNYSTDNLSFNIVQQQQQQQQQQIIQNRRSFVQAISLSTVLLPQIIGQTPNAIAATLTSDAVSTSNANAYLDCLLDLPPVTKDCIRVYLCRHGQTENNRLRLVQGARVDPPLNDTGKQQASRIGIALSRLADQDPSAKPIMAKHSKLKRAKETCELAVRSYSLDQQKQTDGSSLLLELEALPSLGEVDFGPSVEGKKVEDMKANMKKVFAAWSVGLIDEREAPENGQEGGESARDVLLRVQQALELFTQNQNSKDTYSPLLAVSHSTYIRILLATCLNIPLAEAATLQVRNGSINVIDINVKGQTRKLGPKSILFGGPLSLAKSDQKVLFEFPYAHVIRVNEIRHLEGLL